MWDVVGAELGKESTASSLFILLAFPVSGDFLQGMEHSFKFNLWEVCTNSIKSLQTGTCQWPSCTFALYKKKAMLFLVKPLRALRGQLLHVGPPELCVSSHPVSSFLGGRGLQWLPSTNVFLWEEMEILLRPVGKCTEHQLFIHSFPTHWERNSRQEGFISLKGHHSCV